MRDAAKITSVLTLNIFLMDAFRRSLRRGAGINLSQYRILCALASSEGPLRIRDLVESLGMKQATASLDIKEMQERGLVGRDGSPAAEVRRAVFPTPRGLQLLRAGDEAVVEAYRSVYSPLGSELANVNLQGGILGALPTGRIRIRHDEFFAEHAFMEVSLKSELNAIESSHNYGLSLIELRTLLELLACDGALSPGDISRLLLLRPPRIADACGRLELIGLVERRRAPLDKRRREVLLSPEGRALAVQARSEVFSQMMAATGRSLSEKELELTVEIAETCLKHAKKARTLDDRDA